MTKRIFMIILMVVIWIWFPRYTVTAQTPTLDVTPQILPPLPDDIFGFDILIIAGQSNNAFGYAKDLSKDFSSSYIYQLGRNGSDELKIIPATEPLHYNSNYHRLHDRIGYGLRLARFLKIEGFATRRRPILIIPMAIGGTGFTGIVGEDKCWAVGDPCQVDIVTRVNYVMNLPELDNHIIGYFWLQGENDVNQKRSQRDYELDWIAMIRDYERNIKRFSPQTPIFIGEMVPSWIRSKGIDGAAILAAHKHLSSLRPNTYFVSAETPTELGVNDEPNDTDQDLIHYSASSQRQLASYFRTSFINNAKIKPYKPGDIDRNGVTNIFDYNFLVSRFGKDYSIFDYNRIVANFGK